MREITTLCMWYLLYTTRHLCIIGNMENTNVRKKAHAQSSNHGCYQE